MIFSLLTFASAFLIEGLGTWISIIGLSSLFSADPIIIALAGALDAGKLVTVSFLYKRWGTAPRMLRIYMTLATAVLMVITSAGAFGYLSAAFQGAIKDTKQQQVLVTASMEEKAKLEARKKEIDAQIANLPASIVKGRQRLISAFKDEADRTNLRLRQLDQELPKLRMQQITINTHAGPIVYISQAFDVSVEQAVKCVILVIIFVFDPLAIALLVAGNFLWETRRKEGRVGAEASAPANEAIEPQKPGTELAAAVAAPAAMAAPIEALMATDAAPGDDAALHAAAEPQAVHPAPSQSPGEASGIQPPESSGPADADAGLAVVEPEAASEVVAPSAPAPHPEQAIRETAYYLAEKRQFKDGAPADDWLRAMEALEKDGHTIN